MPLFHRILATMTAFAPWDLSQMQGKLAFNYIFQISVDCKNYYDDKQ